MKALPTRLRALLLALVAMLVVAAAPASAADPAPLDQARAAFRDANAAYEAGRFAEALAAYERLFRSGFDTAPVFYNAGTAAFRAGDTGRAVLYYRRALRADPGYDRAVASLGVVSPATNRDGGMSGGFAAAVFSRIGPVAWIAIGVALVLAGAAGLFLALSATTRDQRSHWLWLAGYALVFGVIMHATGIFSYHWRHGGDDAVVMRDATKARSGPTDRSEEILELPAGTVIHLLESPAGGYVRFRLGDGSTGFIALEAIEKV